MQSPRRESRWGDEYRTANLSPFRSPYSDECVDDFSTSSDPPFADPQRSPATHRHRYTRAHPPNFAASQSVEISLGSGRDDEWCSLHYSNRDNLTDRPNNDRAKCEFGRHCGQSTTVATSRNYYRTRYRPVSDTRTQSRAVVSWSGDE